MMEATRQIAPTVRTSLIRLSLNVTFPKQREISQGTFQLWISSTAQTARLLSLPMSVTASKNVTMEVMKRDAKVVRNNLN